MSGHMWSEFFQLMNQPWPPKETDMLDTVTGFPVSRPDLTQPLNAEQMEALESYSQDCVGSDCDYDNLNSALRAESLSPAQSAMVAAIDSAMRPLGAIEVLHRYIDLDFEPLTGRDLAGVRYTELAYASTSLELIKFEAYLHMVIKVPAWVKMVYLEPYSINEQEMEVLLQRGLTFQVDSVIGRTAMVSVATP